MTTPEHVPNLLCWRCRRCGRLVTTEHFDANEYVRLALASGQLTSSHDCSGAVGILDLAGSGPNAPKQETAT